MPGKEKQPLNQDELDEYVRKIRDIASSLAEIRRQMPASLDVMGQKGADRGLKFFNAFRDSCAREMADYNVEKKKRAKAKGPSR